MRSKLSMAVVAVVGLVCLSAAGPLAVLVGVAVLATAAVVGEGR